VPTSERGTHRAPAESRHVRREPGRPSGCTRALHRRLRPARAAPADPHRRPMRTTPRPHSVLGRSHGSLPALPPRSRSARSGLPLAGDRGCPRSLPPVAPCGTAPAFRRGGPTVALAAASRLSDCRGRLQANAATSFQAQHLCGRRRNGRVRNQASQPVGSRRGGPVARPSPVASRLPPGLRSSS
jgi:hypothetical protein